MRDEKLHAPATPALNTVPMTGRPKKPHTPSVSGAGDNFRGVLGAIAYTRSSVSTVFADFCRITACCLAVQTREDEYRDAIKPYSRHDLDQLAKAMGLLIQEMEDKPFEDVLGIYYTQTVADSDRHRRGEFYTPPNISEMMARMSLDPEKIRAERKPVTVSDPCCGSGGMVLACAKLMLPDVDLLRVTLQDINPVACDMAYINMTLWGVPAEVVLGSALTAEVRSRWANIHWHRIREDERRKGLRILNQLQELTSPPEAGSEPPSNEEDTTPNESAGTSESTHIQIGLFDPEP